jgi:hypothetical protein
MAKGGGRRRRRRFCFAPPAAGAAAVDAPKPPAAGALEPKEPNDTAPAGYAQRGPVRYLHCARKRFPNQGCPVKHPNAVEAGRSSRRGISSKQTRGSDGRCHGAAPSMAGADRADPRSRGEWLRIYFCVHPAGGVPRPGASSSCGRCSLGMPNPVRDSLLDLGYPGRNKKNSCLSIWAINNGLPSVKLHALRMLTFAAPKPKVDILPTNFPPRRAFKILCQFSIPFGILKEKIQRRGLKSFAFRKEEKK